VTNSNSPLTALPSGTFRLEHVALAALPGVRFAVVRCERGYTYVDAMTPGTPENAALHTVKFGTITDLHPEIGVIMQTGQNSWGYCAFTCVDPRYTARPLPPAAYRYVWCGYFASEAEAVAACRAIDALANPVEGK